MREGRFHIPHYTSWNESRLRAINDFYDEGFFKGKKVLEVGCGWADIGNEISKLGAHVTASDARIEHMEKVKLRHPHMKTQLFDLENTDEWVFEEEKYDVIIHFGVLYHLSNPVENLKFISKHCDHLIIETEVLDSDNPELVNFVQEENRWEHGAWGMAFSGTGCRPSYALVENALSNEGMVVTRAPKPEMVNAGAHNYDWERKNTGKMNRVCQRAMWFCHKK
jgi:cyclopropane fatty-acyl-phospholipid synthase-like methyltransferase